MPTFSHVTPSYTVVQLVAYGGSYETTRTSDTSKSHAHITRHPSITSSPRPLNHPFAHSPNNHTPLRRPHSPTFSRSLRRLSRSPHSRSLLCPKRSYTSTPSFTATSASQTVALLCHGHFCLPSNRPPLSRSLLLLFHGHFCLPNNRTPLSWPLLPPKQSPSSFTVTSALLSRPLLPSKQSPSSFTATSAFQTTAFLLHVHFCSSFTATSAFRTIALLFHGHFCLPNDRPPLSQSLLPPERSLLFQGHFCLSNNRNGSFWDGRCRVSHPAHLHEHSLLDLTNCTSLLYFRQCVHPTDLSDSLYFSTIPANVPSVYRTSCHFNELVGHTVSESRVLFASLAQRHASLIPSRSPICCLSDSRGVSRVTITPSSRYQRNVYYTVRDVFA